MRRVRLVIEKAQRPDWRFPCPYARCCGSMLAWLLSLMLALAIAVASLGLFTLLVFVTAAVISSILER